MDPMENLVRDVLREHASDAPTVVPEIRSRRRATTWLITGASAAAVVVFAATLAIVRHDDSGTGGAAPPATSPTPAPTTPAVYAAPPGFKTVAYHGFTVDVPDDLPVLTVPCKLPQQYVVEENPNVMYDCVASDAEAPTLTIRLSSATATWRGIAMHPDTVHDVAVEVGYGTVDGYAGAAGQLAVSTDDVGLMVTAPDRATVETILTSIRQQADPDGCEAVPGELGNAPADELLPPGAESAVRCVYAQGPADGEVLQASLPVRSDMFDEVVAGIRGLPAAGSSTNPQPPYEFDLLRVSYPDGVVRTLAVSLDDPTLYSDGTRTVQDSGNYAVTDLLRTATTTGH